ncbi:MAG: AAA family ATPase [Verrucomicrobiales bacterium]|nr:AAA family ATPase [Verrucomicrobiales bacterium]
MRIDRVEIENFKGIEKESFKLDSNFTVFVGENGSGKTTVLDAVSFVLFPWIMGAASRFEWHDGFVRIVPDELSDSGQFREVFPVSVVATGKVCEEQMTWKRKDDSKTYLDQSIRIDEGLQPFVSKAEKLRASQGEKNEWPLLSYYRADRGSPPVNSADWNKIMTAKLIRPDGYLDWSDSEQSTSAFIEWMGRQEAIAFQESSESQAAKAVKAAVLSCLPNATKFGFSARLAEPVVHWEDGTTIPFSKLSHGQRATISLVGDIARRAAIINPHLEGSTIGETPGVVLIDELDLHLHPRWQRRIVDDLKRTFPKIQFIATSHSPFIIQSLEPGELRVLGREEPKIEYSNQGIEEIIRFIQGVESPEVSERYAEKKKAAKQYFEMLRDGKTLEDEEVKDAKEKLDKITASYSANPALDAFLDVKTTAASSVVREDSE